MHTPAKGGHAGILAARSLARSPSSSLPLPQLSVCLLGLLLPTRGRRESSSLSSTVSPLHSASHSDLQIQDVLASHGSARSVLPSAPCSAVSCLGRLGLLCGRREAPRIPAHPLGQDSVLGCPRLVSPSPQLQLSRLAPALPRSLPLSPGSGPAPSPGAASY